MTAILEQETDRMLPDSTTTDSTITSEITEAELGASIATANTALRHCFSNRFNEAQRIIDAFPVGSTSLYHAITESHFAVLQALFTFEPELIEIAHPKVRRAAELCQTLRRKNTLTQTIGSWWGGGTHAATFQQFTELELHAELCHAECLLAQALLTFIQDEQLTRFIEGALKIRSSYSTYKYCMQAMLHNTAGDSDESVNHIDFTSGVYLGMGTFNVLLSLLPPRILKMLEWVGFQGDRKEGLEWLNTGLKLSGLRSPLCAMALLNYHLTAVPSIGVPTAPEDEKYIKTIAEKCLQDFPNGSIFLYYSARFKLSQGLTEDAMSTYGRAVSLHTEWQQVRHLSYWGMMWCHGYQGSWMKAANCAQLLADESRWSKCVYSYLTVAFMLAERFERQHRKRVNGDENADEQDDGMEDQIRRLMDDVKKHKKRIAGKSLQMEKLAVARADKYQQTGKLILPALEMIYIWNGFGYMSKDGNMLEHILSLITSVLEEPGDTDEPPSVHHSNISLCFLLKGSCLRHLKRTKEAENYLTFVANGCFLPESCEFDTYVAPYASAEIGATYADEGDYEKAIEQYEKTLTDYSKYGLESRLHFRLQNRIDGLKELINSGTMISTETNKTATTTTTTSSTITTMNSLVDEGSDHSDDEFFDAED